MRKLCKAPEPARLQKKSKELTETYKAAPANAKPSPWRADSIFDALLDETLAKCAYCESRVGAVTWEHVEHIRPKSLFPDEVVLWENLTLACPKCNGLKGDYYSATHPLLNPYVDEPEEHLLFEFAFLRARPGDVRAVDTIRVLRLYRQDLQDRRLAALEGVESLVHDWARASEPMAAAISELILDRIGDDAEFVMFLRAYLSRVGYPWSELLSARQAT